ncbi:hypothetical protein COU54_03060 [Candidatus Pacearchaeota archaeon CG10_big_fil_rev_8_21_14_0_10_31_24]|nr:MAG: hypothetical protein COU54_03060 [Candidatus Pacearchaeota archaeon CG10_big_fil_rev_8_21_14_0_10_31_24]
MVKEALAVPREILFAEKNFLGFLPKEEYDYFNIIINNHEYYERTPEFEHNPLLQQVIPYVWIINPQTKQIFFYRRAPDENQHEIRLRNKWSGGIGGHIENKDDSNPIYSAMMRELMEEVKINNYPQPKVIGYINDESGSVERSHFGVLALAETTEEVSKGDNEMAEGRFMDISEIDSLISQENNEFDKWTLISWPIVKEYITKL